MKTATSLAQPQRDLADTPPMESIERRLAICCHYCETADEWRESARLFCVAAHVAAIMGRYDLRDRLVERAGECLAAAYQVTA